MTNAVDLDMIDRMIDGEETPWIGPMSDSQFVWVVNYLLLTLVALYAAYLWKRRVTPLPGTTPPGVA